MNERTVSLAGIVLSTLFGDPGLCAWWFSPESTECCSPHFISKTLLSFLHLVWRKAEIIKRPHQGIIENLNKRLRPHMEATGSRVDKLVA